MSTRVIGFFTANSTDFNIQRGEGGDLTDYNVSLTDADWWPSGDASLSTDGSGDLAAHIQDVVRALGAAIPFANFDCTVDTSTGIFSMNLDPGETATLTWNDTDLRDWLRYSGATTALSSTPASGSRVHKRGFYPTRTTVVDLPIKPTPSTQSISDNGVVHTVSYATRIMRQFQFLFQGGPRDSVYREFQSMEDLVINHIAQGKRWRHYPDLTVLAAYAEVTEPKGYQEWVAQLPADWEPQPRIATWYEWFDYNVTAHEYRA